MTSESSAHERTRDVDPETGGQRRYLRQMGGDLWVTWGDDWNHDDEVINLTALLKEHGMWIVGGRTNHRDL